jgi:hypothetical protein
LKNKTGAALGSQCVNRILGTEKAKGKQRARN